MFARFEMRVWEAEENLGKLGLVEEVREEFHGVGAQAGDVLVEGAGGRVLGSEGGNAVLDVGCDLEADFEAYEGLALSVTLV